MWLIAPYALGWVSLARRPGHYSLDGGLDDPLGEVLRGHVAADGDGLAARLFNLVHDRLGLDEVEVRDDDAAPLGRKEQTRRSANALSSAGNDRGLAAKCEPVAGRRGRPRTLQGGP